MKITHPKVLRAYGILYLFYQRSNDYAVGDDWGWWKYVAGVAARTGRLIDERLLITP